MYLEDLEILSENSELILKNPYLTFVDGQICLFLENCSELHLNESKGDTSELDMNALKQKGNEFFSKNFYIEAIKFYTKGTNLHFVKNFIAIDENPVNPILYSNRSQAYQNISDFYKAKKDSKIAIQLDSTNQKYQFKFATAIAGQVEIKQFPGRGNGLFAKLDIKKGDLISVSKAFAFCKTYNSDSVQMDEFLPDKSKKITRIQKKLSNIILEKISNNNSEYNKFIALGQGVGEMRPDVDIEALKMGEPQKDLPFIEDLNLRVQKAVINNSVPYYRNILKRELYGHSKNSCSIGLWLIPSFLNHSCDGNVEKVFIKDICIVTAIKNISAGDEITIPYIQGKTEQERQQFLRENYGFSCNCKLCTYETQNANLMKEWYEFYDRASQLYESEYSIKQVRELKEEVLAYFEKTQEYLPKVPLLKEIQFYVVSLMKNMIPTEEIEKFMDRTDQLMKGNQYFQSGEKKIMETLSLADIRSENVYKVVKQELSVIYGGVGVAEQIMAKYLFKFFNMSNDAKISD